MAKEQKNPKPTSKAKKFFKRAAIIASITAGAMGLAYFAIPGVKEIVIYTIADIIIDIQDKQLVKLDTVKNISFNENDNSLTFDKVEKAYGYYVYVYNQKTNERNEFTVESNFFYVPFKTPIETGDVIEFGVRARGDLQNTKDGDVANYTYEVKFVTEKAYSSLAESFYSIISSRASSYAELQTVEVNAFDQGNGKATIYGTGTDFWNKPANFKISFEFAKMADTLLGESLEIRTDMTNFINGFRNDINGTGFKFETESTLNYINLGEKLVESGALAKYTEDGFAVKQMQFSNGRLNELDDETVEVEYSGIFKATKDDQVIDFKQDFSIQMNKVESFSKNDYYTAFREGQEANVVLKDEYIMNAKTTKFLNLMEKYHGFEMPSEKLATKPQNKSHISTFCL